MKHYWIIFEKSFKKLLRLWLHFVLEPNHENLLYYTTTFFQMYFRWGEECVAQAKHDFAPPKVHLEESCSVHNFKLEEAK